MLTKSKLSQKKKKKKKKWFPYKKTCKMKFHITKKNFHDEEIFIKRYSAFFEVMKSTDLPFLLIVLKSTVYF